MSDFTETKINLILQLVMNIAENNMTSREFKDLCDDYGFWKDTKLWKSGESRQPIKENES